jgi:CorA-like Mg2+ transporter protein
VDLGGRWISVSREGSWKPGWLAETGLIAVPDNGVREVARDNDGVMWIHLDHTDKRGLALLAELIQVRPPDLQDCHTRNPVPKLHAYADHYFTAINGLTRGTDERLHFLPLKIFLTPTLLFTLFGPITRRSRPRRWVGTSTRSGGGLRHPTSAPSQLLSWRLRSELRCCGHTRNSSLPGPPVSPRSS